jgi:lipooligosaccharide transport system permease protein
MAAEQVEHAQGGARALGTAPPDGGGAASVLEYLLVVYRRTFRGSLMSSFLSPLLYLAAMGYGLGALVDRGTSGGIDGVAYVSFIAPGVLAATAMQTGAGESTYPVLGAIKWNGQFHAMLATPLNPRQVLTGQVAYMVVRLLIVCGVFLVVAAVLGATHAWTTPLALPAAVLTGLAFVTPVTALSARVEDGGDSFNVLFRFVLMPLFLFGGTFFPVDQLPGFLQPVAWATPLWHGVELCRGLTLGTGTLAGAAGHVAYLLVFVVVGWVLAERQLTKRLVS